MQEFSTEKSPLTDEQIMDGVIEYATSILLNDSEHPEEKESQEKAS